MGGKLQMLKTVILLMCCDSIWGGLAPSKHTWTYNIRSTRMSTSNESVAGGETHLNREGRGEYSMSGNLYFNVDVPEEFEVMASIYRSNDGGATYKLEPYSVPRTGVYTAINTFYKDIVMSSAAKCSNFPQFEGKLEHVAAQKFTYDRCILSNDGFPTYVSDGIYKFEVKTFGMVELFFEAIVVVEQKTF
ncbi:uncharacterized protein LOC6549797 [Drosophila erecta]|uniref:Uncharacterized protein n=1 Tax=Drosophila erecta TaxID=7220 RepID=B3NT67_DROER|nr:uncharacterized protein LOC6549797 [Drosophila erecta]EDV46247.1 uncharacterized protein Dere_GG18314 [Drosophila erecta]